MAQTPKKPSRPSPTEVKSTPLTRRASARQLRERRRQRLVYIVAGTAIGIAALAILTGVLIEQVWIPSQPVAQVNNATLSRRDYWTERRYQLARDISNNLQLLNLFGGQFSQQFAGQTPALNEQIRSVQSSPVDQTTVDGWIDRTLIEQGAAGMNIQAGDGEIAQLLVTDLNRAFPPELAPASTSQPISGTSALTATAVLTESLVPTSAATTSAVATPDEPTSTAGAISATAALTDVEPMIDPTLTPEPTVTADAALQQENQVLGRLYDAFLAELSGSQARASLSIDDFRTALRDQYRRQVLTNKVQEQLVPQAGFTPSTEPSSITVRHILIEVTEPLTATDSVREAEFAELRPEAEAILQELRDGADFQTLARERSGDESTRENGGELPSFDTTGKTQEGTQIDPAIVAAAEALEPDGISDLVRTPFGWHIVQLVSRVVPSTDEQIQTARTEAFDKWVDERRAEANIQRFPPQTPTAAPEPTSGTAEPLPTVPLGGLPTPITNTASLTDTAALTDTSILDSTPAPVDTTAAPSETSLPATPSVGTAVPTAATGTTVATAVTTAAPTTAP